MADYKIHLGVKLNTSDINTQINGIEKKANPVKIKAVLDTSDFKAKIAGLDEKVKVQAELSTKGFATTINDFNNKHKTVKFNAQLITKDIGTTIKAYEEKQRKIKFGVQLNTKDIDWEIKNYQDNAKSIKLNVELDDTAITRAIEGYKKSNSAKTLPIKVKPDFKDINWNEIERVLGSYKPTTPLKVNVKLLKTQINEQIKSYNDSPSKNAIKLNAKLTGSAIADAVNNYKVSNAENLKIPIDLTLKTITDFDGQLKQKLTSINNKPIDVPVRLMPAAKGFDTQIKKLPINVTAKISNPNIINDEIAKVSGKEVPISIRLKPAAKNFDTSITNKPIPIKAVLEPGSITKINTELVGLKREHPIVIKAKLNPNSINAIDTQLKNLQPEKPIVIDAKLSDTVIDDKDGKKAYTTVKPILDDEAIDAQLESYQAFPISVGVQLDTKGTQPNNKSIDSQLKNYKPSSKIKVGVDLDFRSHKGGQVGVPQQIKDYKTSSKIKVGVELDKNDINEEIQGVKSDNPIELGVKLDLEPVKTQLENLRSEFQKFGKIVVQFPNANNNGNVNGGGNSSGSGNGNGRGGNGGGNGGGQPPIDNIERFTAAVDNSDSVVGRMNAALRVLNVNLDSVQADAITRDIEDMNIEIQKVVTSIKGKSLKLSITGIQETEDGIKRLVTTTKEYKRAVENPLDISRKFTQNFETSYDRQKQQVEEAKIAYREMKSLIKDIQNTKIKKINTEAAGKSVDELSKKIKELQTRYNELNKEFSGRLDNNQSRNITNAQKEADHNVKIAKEAVKSANAEKAKSIRSSFNSYDAEVKNLIRDMQQLSREDEKVEEGIHKVEQALTKMKNAANDDRLIKAENEFQKELKETQGLLLTTQSVEGTEFDREDFNARREASYTKLNSLFQEGSQAAKRFGVEAESLRAELNNVGNVKGVDIVNRKIATLEKNIKNSGLQTKTLSSRLKEQFSKYSQYLSIATAFMYTSMALRNMFEQVKAIDSAMTELKKVTDETDVAYNKFLTNAASKAKEIGTTIDGLIGSTADFARLGYGFEESQKLAEVANIYAVVGDEIDSVETATKSLISTMTAFDVEASNSMSIVDKFNEVGNNFAISSGGIGDALEKSASSMAAANNTLDETIALVTAANTVVQNPEVIGTAFKTISMRIRGAKTELEDAGLETEGMASSTAKLRAEIIALSGVDIMENEDTFKSTYKIMEELAAKWEHLTDIQQASITELIAGKRQGNVVSSLMTNFDIAQNALQTSLNSSGSAMKEHEKWQKSLEAQLLKLKAAWQSLSQSFMSSDFLKVGLDFIIALVDGLNKLIDTFGTLNTLIAGVSIWKIFGRISSVSSGVGGLKSLADILPMLSIAFPNAAKGVSIFTTALSGSVGVVGTLKAAASGLWAVIAAHPIIAAVSAVGLLATIFNKAKEYANELAEKVDEVTSKFKEQQSELVKNKSSFESQSSKYAELSKGVNELGENISLTTNEYSEYQNVVNSIADQIPSLVSGYDSQGNAILSCKGNVEELTKAYEELIQAQNNEVITNIEDIQKDFKNVLKDADKSNIWGTELTTSGSSLLSEMLNEDYSKEEVKNLLDKHLESRVEIASALEDAGLTSDLHLFSQQSDYDEFIANAIENHPDVVRSVIKDFEANIEKETEGMKTIAEAVLSNAFDISDSDYADMSDGMQNIVRQIVGNFDAKKYQDILNSGQSVQEYIHAILDDFKELESSGESKKIEAAFDLKTKFNGGEISYGEYVKNLEDAGKVINGLGLENEITSKIKLSIGLNEEGFVEEYQNLVNRLSDHTNYDFDPRIYSSDAKKFLDSLSAEELSVAIDVITKLSNNGVKETIQDIRNAINREMAIQGLAFDLNLESEIENIDAFNTALEETVSATGLSSESISALKGRYAELESQGYDLSNMFEETSNGIHLNRKAISELEQAYAKQKQNNIKKDLDALEKEYKLLTEDINNCTDAGERASLYIQRDAIIQQINDAATLAAQYDGLTSAYNNWLAVEDGGQERDMYEKLIEGFETAGDEISRGWLDDGTIKFLELLTGKTDLAFKSGKELKKVYDSLGDKIGSSNYSIRDFFTVDEDGNSTNTGVYNFLETVETFEDKLGDIIKRENGNIVGFDFKVAGGDEAIAEALGISEELVQIMVRAADDAGFVVDIDGAYTQLADLKTEAEAANNALKKLYSTSNGEFGTDHTFNFAINNIDDANKELGKIKEVLNQFKNEDGTFNINAEGAKEALDIAEYLQITKDKLEEPSYMSIDTSELEEELQKPIEQLQKFEKLTQEENLLNLTGEDKKRLSEINGELDEITTSLSELDDNIKVKLGIDGMTPEQIREELENGNIEIPTSLDVKANIDKTTQDLLTLGLFEAGFITEKEAKIRLGIEVDTSEVEEFDITKHADIGKLIQGYTPIKQKVIVEYLAEHEEVDKWSPEQKEALVKYLADGGDPEKFDPEDKESWVVYKADTTEPENYEATPKNQQVTSVLDSSAVDGYQPKPITVWITAAFKGIGSAISNAVSAGKKVLQDRFGVGGVDGTANVNGTTGRAFKQGGWGTKNSGTALVGELGAETLVRDGHYYTIGNSGAEFVKYKKGDIIFNHKQTEELFRNGRVTSGGGRAKAFASGTAFAKGLAFSGGTGGGTGKVTIDTDSVVVTSKNANTTTASGSSGTGGGVGKVNGKSVVSGVGGSSGSSSKEEFKETIDWIEVAIDRIERAISQLDTKANSVYRTWSERNTNLVNEISKVEDEISLQQKAYDRYIKEANSVGLSSSWAEKVRNGEVNIETIRDEALKEKIDDYKTWYEKALDCQDAILDLKEKESELYKQRFDNVASEYDGILGVIEHEKNMLEQYISQSEAQSWLVSANYYNALANNERDNIAQLKKEKADMLTELQSAMESGSIKKNSEAWYEMVNAIDEVTLAITEGETQLLEYQQTIQQLSWETFDLLQEKISSITEETKFLIDLMSNDKLYNDNGQLTDEGSATMGLHGVAYNVNMAQADKYAKEAERLEKELAKDPYDTELEERYREMISLQQEHILAAEDEKEAIRDMVQEGIELELDALQERIDKYNEALDSQKDLYDYQKKVKEQTKEIASLEKQMAAYAGDTSEETKSKVQQLKVSLEEAKTELQETEYERYISDQQQLLDELYLEYEEILNMRLDNIDALLSDMITEINNDSIIIGDTIRENADSVGYTLSDSMSTIWDNNSTKINSVITTYGDKFANAQTTTNNALSTINTNLQNVITQLNSIAKTNVKSSSTSSAANSKQANATKHSTPTTKQEPKQESKTISVGGMINASGAKIYDYAGDTSGETQYYGNDPKYKVLQTNGNWIQVRWHKLSSGITGWFKKGDVKAYATGKKNFSEDEIAWTQDGGREFIVRPSDGAILTPLAKGDSVLNADASKNIWNMANNPSEFIKNNLNLNNNNIPNSSNVQNAYTQHIDNVVFDMKNVKNYDELLAAMQKDKNFEKLILSMSIDRLAGKSSLAKNKIIR